MQTMVLAMLAPALLPTACSTSSALTDSAPVNTLQVGLHCGDPSPGLRPLDGRDADGKRRWLLSMGERPTAGYHITLADERAVVSGKDVKLRVHWQEPAPGSMQAQVITRPCLVFALPDRAYRSVKVVDQTGVVRAGY